MHSLQATVFVCIRKSPCQAPCPRIRGRGTRKFRDAFRNRVIDAREFHDALVAARARRAQILGTEFGTGACDRMRVRIEHVVYIPRRYKYLSN